MTILAQEQKDTIVNVNKDTIVAEEEETLAVKEVEYARPTFESSTLIEGQTNRVYSKGTIEMVMNHRFGLVTGTNDLIGIWAPSNIRIALNYSITDRIAVGFGTTKDSRLQDYSIKVALLKQTVGDKMPVNVTYYSNWAVSALPKEDFYHTSDRWSYFNQIIIARRFSKGFSAQLAPSYSHYNIVARNMNNDLFAVEFGGRAKLTSTMSLLLDINQPFTSQKNPPKTGFSIGPEISSVGHAFQIFISNYRGIVNQQSNMFNQNDFFKGDFVIGFNINRTW